MKNVTYMIVGALLIVFGLVFMFQGLGYLPGSVMTGVTFWAVAGPVIALVGLVVAVIGVVRSRRR